MKNGRGVSTVRPCNCFEPSDNEKGWGWLGNNRKLRNVANRKSIFETDSVRRPEKSLRLKTEAEW